MVEIPPRIVDILPPKLQVQTPGEWKGQAHEEVRSPVHTRANNQAQRPHRLWVGLLVEVEIQIQVPVRGQEQLEVGVELQVVERQVAVKLQSGVKVRLGAPAAEGAPANPASYFRVQANPEVLLHRQRNRILQIRLAQGTRVKS